MSSREEERFCPVCGRSVFSLYCPDDGAVTIERKRGKAAAMPLSIGDQIDGRYRIARVIGRGGFGVVYAARHLVSGQELAIKVLLSDPQGDLEEAVARFHKEARVLGRLRHPNTVRVFDVGYTAKGNLYIAMELLRGPNLEQVFAEMGSRGLTMTEAQTLDVAIPVLASLGEAHRLGLVHRDMKPANIVLVQVPDEPFQVKVLDFGVVRTADSSLTQNQTALGTPAYMSPEQCRSENLDGRSDLYAVGCIMYEAVCGVSPFHSRSPVKTMYQQMESPIPDVRAQSKVKNSPGFVMALRKALCKTADGRFADAREMRRALQTIRAESWHDAPETPLTDLMSEHALQRSSSLWRVVVGDDEEQQVPGAHTAAVPRMGSGSSPPGAGTMPATADAESRPRVDSNPIVSDRVTAAHGDHTAHDLPSFGASASHTRRGAAAPVRTSEAVEVDNVPEGALTGLPWGDEPQLMVPDGLAAAEDDGAVEPGSQQAVRLPSLGVIEDAIRRREEQLAVQAMDRSEAPTLHELDPSKGADPEADKRLPQVAPSSAADERGRGRKANFGKGTLIGVGFKHPDEDDKKP